MTFIFFNQKGILLNDHFEKKNGEGKLGCFSGVFWGEGEDL